MLAACVGEILSAFPSRPGLLVEFGSGGGAAGKRRSTGSGSRRGTPHTTKRRSLLQHNANQRLHKPPHPARTDVQLRQQLPKLCSDTFQPAHVKPEHQLRLAHGQHRHVGSRKDRLELQQAPGQLLHRRRQGSHQLRALQETYGEASRWARSAATHRQNGSCGCGQALARAAAGRWPGIPSHTQTHHAGQLLCDLWQQELQAGQAGLQLLIRNA